MLYQLYEMQHAMLTPLRLSAEMTKACFENPWNPLSHTQLGKNIAASSTMFERLTRRFGQPEWMIADTVIDGKSVDVVPVTIVEKPFCRLTRFKRSTRRKDPQVLVVAPISGHFATLLRGTVQALLPHHDVYITEWIDARMVPVSEGRFNLDDCITYLREFMSLLGPNTHIIAVCQPAVPVLAAVSLMATEKDPNQPLTMTLMGGPIDTRISPTAVTQLAEERPLSWFENTVVQTVPAFYPGAYRKVYPGFLQLTGFMSMNLDRHVGSHLEFFKHLVVGDGDSADKHRKFYNEYLAVMDITAEFYLQTVETVFQKQLLPRGRMKWRDPHTEKLVDVRPQDIKKTALFTIEGELDDISARGQTTAAHTLCFNLAQSKQFHHLQQDCGHYGIFNGSRWRTQIMPRVRNFIRQHEGEMSSLPAIDLEKVPDLKPDRFSQEKHGPAAIKRWLKSKESEK